jgi:5-methylcytosine-specific restriction endonuclease McrA
VPYKDPEKDRECQQKYREEHRAEALEYAREYRTKNRDEILAKKRDYNSKHYEANHEELLEQQRQNYRANKEKVLKRCQEYRKKNPEKCRIWKHNRRAKLKENGGTFTFRELNEQFERQEGFCYYCGELLYKSFDSSVHIDHKTPISRGGSNNISNIALACSACNQKKFTKTAEEFMEMIK